MTEPNVTALIEVLNNHAELIRQLYLSHPLPPAQEQHPNGGYPFFKIMPRILTGDSIKISECSAS